MGEDVKTEWTVEDLKTALALVQERQKTAVDAMMRDGLPEAIKEACQSVNDQCQRAISPLNDAIAGEFTGTPPDYVLLVIARTVLNRQEAWAKRKQAAATLAEESAPLSTALGRIRARMKDKPVGTAPVEDPYTAQIERLHTLPGFADKVEEVQQQRERLKRLNKK